MILMITNRQDLTADYVIDYLRQRAIPYFRLNVDDFPDRLGVTYRTGCDSTSGSLQTQHHEVTLAEITAVWYRRALAPPASQWVDEEHSAYARQESARFLEGALLTLEVPWVNSIVATQLGERKLYVLSLARRVGLIVPSTVASNSPDVLSNFADGHQPLILKPVHSGLQITPEGAVFSAYTQPFDAALLRDRIAVESCPTLLQQRIDKIEDVRVTIFGERVFAVGIRSNGAPDWRVPGTRISYQEIVIDAETLRGCHALMNRLGLRYGAFDFARDFAGRLHFLEVNPAGEWAWLEEEMGLQMRQALCNLLVEDVYSDA